MTGSTVTRIPDLTMSFKVKTGNVKIIIISPSHAQWRIGRGNVRIPFRNDLHLMRPIFHIIRKLVRKCATVFFFCLNGTSAYVNIESVMVFHAAISSKLVY